MTFYSAAIPKFIYDCLQFVGPWVLGLLITYLGEDPEDPEHTAWYGIGLVSLLVVSYVVRTFLINIYFHINFRTGMHVCFPLAPFFVFMVLTIPRISYVMLQSQ